MKWSKYNYIYTSPKHGTLLFNMLSGAFFDISDLEAKADILRLKENPDTYDFEDNKDIYEQLVSSGVLCEDDTDNKNLMHFNLLSARFQENKNHITILPTLDCNLACKYCFEEANRSNTVMSKEVIGKLKEYISEKFNDKNRELNIAWFGGEPLMAFPVMEEITRYVESIGIPFRANIITNGVLLTKSKIQKLESLKIKQLQITLDGNTHTHDTKRIFKNGKGTYDIIMTNLTILHDYIKLHDDIHVDIRISIDKESEDQYHELYFEFKEKFPLFYVYPGIIIQYKTCYTNLPCFVNQREEAEFHIRQYEKYGIASQEFNISMKGMRNCMAEHIDTDMVGPKGELYLCLQDAGNKDAEIGSIFNGKNNLRLISAYCSGNLTFNSEECRDCKVVTFCGGGCVNKRYRKIKYGEEHQVCAAYKDQDMLERYLDLHYEIKKNLDKKS